MLAIDAARQGIVQAGKSLERTAARIANPGASAAGGDAVNLSDEAVSLLTARNAYEANLQTLRTGDEMNRKLLDIFA